MQDRYSKESYGRCPSCGKDLKDPHVYSFHGWATVSIVTLISLMLLALDVVNGKNAGKLEWAHWAIVGIWIFYVTTQLLRYNPDYGWILVPFGGILFIIFFFYLDRLRGNNSGYLGLDWAWNVIIPVATFLVILPILARLSRKQVNHIDVLENLVESLEEK